MKNLTSFAIGLFLVLSTLGTSWATQLRYSVTIATDDSMEKYGGDPESSASGSQLWLGRRLIGLRFQNVLVPNATTITGAWLEFHASSSNLDETIKLQIKGEDNDTPATFNGTKNDISNRWNSSATTASYDWDSPSSAWTNNQLIQIPAPTSTGLVPVIQEIVSRSDWDSGDDIVILISRRDSEWNQRDILSWEGKGGIANYAPTLVIEFGTTTTTPPSGACEAESRVNLSTDDGYQKDSDDNPVLSGSTLPWGDRWLGLRFTSLSIPQGANITAAYLDLATGYSSNYGDYNDDSTARVKIWGHDTNNAVTFSFTDGTNDIRSRSRTSSPVNWSASSDWDNYKALNRSPDISSVVQEIVSRTGWASGNAMALLLEDDGGRRPVLAFDDSTNGAALGPFLHVEYDCTTSTTPQAIIQVSVASSVDSAYLGASTYTGGTPDPDTLTIKNIGTATMNYTISGLPEWMTLTSTTGTTVLTSSSTIASSLAINVAEAFTVNFLNYDSGGPLGAGTYVATLTVNDPSAQTPDKTIQISYTVLDDLDTSGSCSSIPLYVRNQVNPAVLINLDLSGSMTSNRMAVVDDIMLSQTPDLSAVIQEIVNRTGWVTGNDMAFIISRTSGGNRQATSFDNNTAVAPLLSVRYSIVDATLGTLTSKISVRISAAGDDAEQDSGGGNFSTSENILDLGNKVVGLRFRSIDIPQAATILGAVIQFSPDAADAATTTLNIAGQAIDDAPQFSSSNDIVSRTKTTSQTNWSVAAWVAPTQKTRLAIAQDVIKKIVQNQSINWGYATWEGNNSDANFTTIEVGCKVNSPDHLSRLTTAVDLAYKGGNTPFVPSMNAAGDYFVGGTTGRLDVSYNERFNNLTCQDKFLIEITDGLANNPSSTSVADHIAATTALAHAGVSTVAVGFGISNSPMLDAVAATANTLGAADLTDSIYALHEEAGSPAVGVPFVATNQETLLNQLLSITHKIENSFLGAAPAPTTSASDDDLLVVLVAEFGSASWSGNLRARGYSLLTNAFTTDLWVATEKMPSPRTIWTINSTTGVKELYSASSLYTGKTLCDRSNGTETYPLVIGDIINSAPLIVKWPNSYYSIDGYSAFYNSQKDRNKMVYVGANDGQLHAFLLSDILDSSGAVVTAAGTEMWSFIPESMLGDLKQADTDLAFDMCSSEYCHRYSIDGSPQAADIFVGSDWHTILVTGMREGGESYFALDVTDGKPMQAGTDGAQFLWEYSDTPDLGQTWADVKISRVEDTAVTNGRVWGVFFGSGYAGAGPDSSAQLTKQAYLYGLDAYTSQNIWQDASGVSINKIKITGATTVNNDALSEVLVMDKDSLPDFTADFIYTGNLHGDMFRVKDIGKGQEPDPSIFYESNNAGITAPIRARASYFDDKLPGSFWLYFGTGRYEVNADKTTNNQQYFFGLKEVPDSSGNYTRQYVKPATLDSVTIPLDATTLLAANGSPADLKLAALKTTSYTYNYTVGGTAKSRMVKVVEGQNDQNDPWAIRLGTDATYSERSINQSLAAHDIVFFTTFVPDQDPCGGSGKSYLYAVDYQTGKALDDIPLFDLNEDGLFNDDDRVQDSSNTMVFPAAIDLGDGLVTQPVMVGDKLFMNTTDPTKETVVIPIPIPNPAGVDSWLDRSLE